MQPKIDLITSEHLTLIMQLWIDKGVVIWVQKLLVCQKVEEQAQQSNDLS